MFPVLKDNFRRYNNLSTQPPIWNKTERTKNRFVSWNVLLQDILKDNERISHKQAVEKAIRKIYCQSLSLRRFQASLVLIRESRNGNNNCNLPINPLYYS